MQKTWMDSIDVTSVAVALLVVVLSSILLLVVATIRCHNRNNREVFEYYQIEPCPNPNCIRCRKYAQVNTSAQERLDIAVAKLQTSDSDSSNSNSSSHHEMKNDPFRRVIDAVQRGPRYDSSSEICNTSNKNNTSSVLSPRSGQHPTVLLVRGLTAEPLVTSMHRNACTSLQAHRPVLLEEYIQSQQTGQWLENDVTVLQQPSSIVISEQDSNRSSIAAAQWQVLHLLNQGVWMDQNARQCPKTVQLLEQLSLMQGCIFGNAFFSVVTPGTAIEPHCGPSNVRHRLHMALQVPSQKEKLEEPTLTVLDQHVLWKEGDCFVFDDSLAHSVTYPHLTKAATKGTKHDSDAEARVVLIVDLWHPELAILERQLISELYPSLQD